VLEHSTIDREIKGLNPAVARTNGRKGEGTVGNESVAMEKGVWTS
jgi:hypothetical protein